MPKVGLFSEYKNEEKKGFDHIICYNTKRSGSNIGVYSRTRSFYFESNGYYVFVAISIHEVGLLLKKYKIDESKALFYHLKDEPNYVRCIKLSLPKLTLISAVQNPRVILDITEEGFKWDNYDNVSMPKQDKDTKGNKPTT
jgi:hypothetical protein